MGGYGKASPWTGGGYSHVAVQVNGKSGKRGCCCPRHSGSGEVEIPTSVSEGPLTKSCATREKKLVVVADVPVALLKVKFWRVEEAFIKRLPRVDKPVVVMELTESRPLASIERAAVVDVAVPATVVVAK